MNEKERVKNVLHDKKPAFRAAAASVIVIKNIAKVFG